MATVTQARIDEEIAIRSQTNTSPICRIPPELLAPIFIRCASDHYDLDPSAFRSELGACDVPSWVNFSYVCRYWRAVALNCPTLWAYHFVVSVRWTEELLSRSQQASLKIRIPFALPTLRFSWWSHLEKLLDHTERIQELIARLPCTEINQFLYKLSESSPAPRLQNLEIWVLEGTASRWDSPLFHGETPALHTLVLSSCPVSWNSLKLSSNLITLSLHHARDRFPQSMEEILAALSCMQNLTCLDLCDVLPGCQNFISSMAFNSLPRINLPYLSRLFIDAPPSTIIAFLAYVNIPLKTELRLACYPEDDHSLGLDHYALLSSLLAQRLGISISEDPALSSPIIRSLTIYFTFGEATLTFSTSKRDFNSSVLTRSHSREHWGCNIPLEITLYWGCSESWSGEDHITTINFSCSLPLAHVQSVRIINPPFTSAFWRKMLAHVQGLRYIKLNNGRMPDLASVLSLTIHEDEENKNTTGDPDSDSDHSILAPHLEELELCKITFPPGGDSNLPLAGPVTTLHSVFDALSTRDVPRGRLIVTECCEQSKGEFNLDIPNVVWSWDGVVVLSESDLDS